MNLSLLTSGLLALALGLALVPEPLQALAPPLAPSGAPAVPIEVYPVTDGYLWQIHASSRHKAYLQREGITQGVYFHTGEHAGKYFLWGPADSRWLGAEVPLPCALPEPFRPVTPPALTPASKPSDSRPQEPEQNFGVVTEKIAEAPAYALNGRPCTRKEALAAVENGQLPDDAHKLRLTVIGSVADRERVLRDLDSLPQARDTYVIQDYEVGEWPLACGFVAGSPGPTIYVQKPDGKVLHRQTDYADGVQGLTKALRKVDPAYDATKDPDLRKDSSPLTMVQNLPIWVWALGGLGLFWFLNNRKPS
jgi:hypothetical protein